MIKYNNNLINSQKKFKKKQKPVMRKYLNNYKIINQIIKMMI